MTKEEKAKYDKDYHSKNKEKRKVVAKEWRDNNKDKVVLYEKNNSSNRKTYYETNKKSINKKTSLKRKENSDDWNEYRRANYKKKMNNDPVYKLRQNIKSLISNSFKAKGIRKKSKTLQILGCSFIEYKKHIEKQFELWMNWTNLN